MKLYDLVEIISDEYEKKGVAKGLKGSIALPEIRDNGFEIELIDKPKDVFELQFIKIKHLKILKDQKTSDEIILKELPANNPKWWCKVENGYIMNLLGEKKTKFLMIMILNLLSIIR